MAKVAVIKLRWTRSVSADVASRVIEITKNGEVSTFELGPEVSDYQIEVEASSNVQFKTTVKDSEGQVATSDTYSFSLGDLEPPQPDTELGHTVMGVHDAAPPDAPVL